MTRIPKFNFMDEDGSDGEVDSDDGKSIDDVDIEEYEGAQYSILKYAETASVLTILVVELVNLSRPLSKLYAIIGSPIAVIIKGATGSAFLAFVAAVVVFVLCVLMIVLIIILITHSSQIE